MHFLPFARDMRAPLSLASTPVFSFTSRGATFPEAPRECSPQQPVGLAAVRGKLRVCSGAFLASSTCRIPAALGQKRILSGLFSYKFSSDMEICPKGLSLGVELPICSRPEGIPGLQILPARFLFPRKSMQLSAPAAPRPPGVGLPPFGATSHPARTPAGADPQGLRAHLPTLSGCGLGQGWSLLGHRAWPGGVVQQDQGGWWWFLEVPVAST